jgi:hypothetical protein
MTAALMTPAMTTPELEAVLFRLYVPGPMTEVAREFRAELARLYYAATGRWFAARFYY